MSEAPERISVYPLEGTWDYGGMEFAEGDEPGLVEYVRADRIEELEAKLKTAVEEAEKYQRAFVAQSRKLHAVLHIDGVRTTLIELTGGKDE